MLTTETESKCDLSQINSTYTGAPCPICREIHHPQRELSFDGHGINSCDMYRSRLATLSKDCPNELGQLFASAPDLLRALKFLRQELRAARLNLKVEKHFSLLVADSQASKVIEIAEGRLKARPE